MNEQITGALFKRMVLHGAAVITAQKQAINDLNVFPVPDGDTGTNMSMTIGTAVTELRKTQPATIDQAASVTASALLRGARGNSGVILSLLFRGLSKALKGRETADAAAFAAAMQEGVSAAYKAVMKPAEGTVLTVSRLAAKQAADTAAAGETDLEKVLEDAIRVGYATLAQTTEMNPVLKKAGVVDAGGKGYLLILDGMLAELRGEPMPETEAGEPKEEKADFAAMAAEDITFAFDTVFIVRKAMADISLEPLRTYLNSIGDSLVIGEDDEAFKVHVHTNIPGNALNEAQKYGTLELAKIENMRTQADDLAAGKHVQSTDDLDAVEAELESAPAEEQTYVENIRAESRRMKKLVEEMLTLFRAESVRRETAFSEVDLSDVVTDAALRFEPVVFESGRRLLYTIDEGLQVSGDRDALERLTGILLDNAVKYAPQGTDIHLTLTHQDRTACLAVENGGDPIPPEVAAHLFDRFYRADSSRTGTGFGLGLAIARAIVQNHKGSIICRSQEGLNRFSVTLPVLRQKETQ